MNVSIVYLDNFDIILTILVLKLDADL